MTGPTGGYATASAITKRIAEEAKGSTEEADRLIRMYLSKDATEDQIARITSRVYSQMRRLS